jgi:hypothetical protein
LYFSSEDFGCLAVRLNELSLSLRFGKSRCYAGSGFNGFPAFNIGDVMAQTDHDPDISSLTFLDLLLLERNCAHKIVRFQVIVDSGEAELRFHPSR